MDYIGDIVVINENYPARVGLPSYLVTEKRNGREVFKTTSYNGVVLYYCVNESGRYYITKEKVIECSCDFLNVEVVRGVNENSIKVTHKKDMQMIWNFGTNSPVKKVKMPLKSRKTGKSFPKTYIYATSDSTICLMEENGCVCHTVMRTRLIYFPIRQEDITETLDNHVKNFLYFLGFTDFLVPYFSLNKVPLNTTFSIDELEYYVHGRQ